MFASHDSYASINDAKQQRELGGLTIDPETGYEYMYVQFLDAITYAAGQSLTWAAVARTKVTNDRSGGSSISLRPAGICLAVMTQNYFGYILRRGVYTTVVTNADDDIAQGDALIIDDNEDGQCDSVALATTTVHTNEFGFALDVDVDAADTVPASINCR